MRNMQQGRGVAVLAVAAIAATLAATVAGAQAKAPEPSPTPLAVVYEKVPGVELRFVNYRWRPEIFEPMADGGPGPVESKRPWSFGRILNDVPLKLGTRTLPVGHGVIVFNPNLDGKGMTFELRRVDMRDVLQPNAWAPIPAGDTMWKGPAKFETVPETADRFVVSISEAGGKGSITIRYGNRRAVLSFTR